MNFRFCKKKKKCRKKLESAIFSSWCHEDVKWCLKCYPNGRDEDSKDYVSMFLRLAESKANKARTEINVSIVNVDRKPIYPRSSGHTEHHLVGQPWSCVKFASRTAPLKLTTKRLHDGTLTIFCKVSFSEGDPLTVWGEHIATVVNVPACQLSEDYGRLFQSERFGDVVLKIGDRELRAHKGIRVAR